jgi:hypothetical protein
MAMAMAMAIVIAMTMIIQNRKKGMIIQSRKKGGPFYLPYLVHPPLGVIKNSFYCNY